ncbi:MAG: MFS transporter [Actinomycetes bacterium]
MWKLLRENRDIRLLFIAQVISYLGDWFTFVALAGLVEDATGSKFLVSLVMVAFSLPSFLASPIAGPAADRYDRKKVLVLVSCFQAFAAFGLIASSGSRIWMAFLFQSAISALAAFIRPSSEAALPNLARTPDELAKANSLLGATWGIMLAVGAGLGGLFSQAFGRTAAFLADGITFLIAAVLFAAIHTKMQEHRTHQPGDAKRPRMRPLDDMKEALHLAREDKVILALVASKTTFAIGAGIVSQLAVLASDVFKSGDAGRGMLIGVRGIGSGLGPIIGARLVKGNLQKLLFTCGIAGLLFSVFYLGAAVSPNIAIAGICVALAHFGGGAQWTLSSYGLQMRSPDAVRGRVLAGDFAIVTLMLSLSSAASGLLADAVGVRVTIAIFAVTAALASVSYLVLTKPIRERLRTEQQHP